MNHERVMSLLNVARKTKREAAMRQRQERREREPFVRLAMDLIAIQKRAHDMGLHVTARAINQAVSASGWESSGDTVKAAACARGEHPLSGSGH